MGRREDNVVLTKSFDFSVRIVNLHKYLCSTMSEYVMSKQLLRCGTSIGANLSEAEEAVSAKDFEAKIYIALKEARETEYWLRLLYRTEYLTEYQYGHIMADCHQILSILVAITKTLRKNRRE
ncbi:MAG: four helix bundle protein [Duncaniella sp.]|nr:four helix bundle protein [Duncaniella sp.]